ncbi:MAG TPA: ATP-binding protein [bacterium]|nr:ATP-binding protein [bacterium]
MTGQKARQIDTIEIVIPAKPQFLKIIRSAVNSICEIRKFCREDMNNVILAVDEACSNIIKHAYGKPTNQPIQATIKICDDRFEIHLRDYGKKADSNKIKPRQLDDLRPGGLGVHFIKSVMDEVVYDNTPDKGNLLKLVKIIAKN